MKVINTFKYKTIYSLLFVSMSSFANNSWTNKEAHLQCGLALVQLNAECKIDPQYSTVNVCRNYHINIIKDSKVLTFPLPHMPESQRKILEKQGYKFNNIVEAGNWAPQDMGCYENKYIIIGYSTGMSNEEGVDGSLTSNSSAPFFDFSGGFILRKKEDELRDIKLKGNNNDLYVNFINR